MIRETLNKKLIYTLIFKSPCEKSVNRPPPLRDKIAPMVPRPPFPKILDPPLTYADQTNKNRKSQFYMKFNQSILRDCSESHMSAPIRGTPKRLTDNPASLWVINHLTTMPTLEEHCKPHQEDPNCHPLYS